jgi:hypothetical protein
MKDIHEVFDEIDEGGAASNDHDDNDYDDDDDDDTDFETDVDLQLSSGSTPASCASSSKPSGPQGGRAISISSGDAH